MSNSKSRSSDRRSSFDSNEEPGDRARDEFKDDRKSRAVFCLRVVTILTLIAAAVATATLTFVYVSRDEEDDFNTQYQDSVVKVAEAFQKVRARTSMTNSDCLVMCILLQFSNITKPGISSCLRFTYFTGIGCENIIRIHLLRHVYVAVWASQSLAKRNDARL